MKKILFLACILSIMFVVSFAQSPRYVYVKKVENTDSNQCLHVYQNMTTRGTPITLGRCDTQFEIISSSCAGTACLSLRMANKDRCVSVKKVGENSSMTLQNCKDHTAFSLWKKLPAQQGNYITSLDLIYYFKVHPTSLYNGEKQISLGKMASSAQWIFEVVTPTPTAPPTRSR
jgi:hypothetical protein